MTDLDAREIETVMGPFVARAVRTDAHGWITLICPEQRDLWLCVGTTGPILLDAVAFTDETADRERLCALLGSPWEELAADFIPTVLWQQQCLRRMPPKMWAQFAGESIDEILDWRREVMSMTLGEQLVSRVTGAEPRAIRN